MTASSLLVEPAFRSVPAFRDTLGPEVSFICAEAGFAPDPEQSLALDALFAFGVDNKVAAFEFAVVCSRQNMKTGLFKMAALGWLFVSEQELIVWSAHEMKTTKEAFRDLENLITGYPPFKARLADGPSEGIFRGNGEEMIELAPTPATPNGQRIMFKARTAGGGRGLSGDKVILDEAFALKPNHMGSLLPTLSARPDPQVVYGSSAGLAESEVLRGIRDRGREGRGRLAYFEWCAPEGGCESDACDHKVGTAVCALDDRENWRRANPAMGRRISEEYIAAERDALPPEEFARERLGWWDEPLGAEVVLDFAAWSKLEDPASRAESITAFGVEVAKDRSSASIGACGPREDGNLHLEVVDRRGRDWLTWLLSRCLELNTAWQPAAFVVDEGGPAASLIPEFEAAGLTVLATTTADVAAASVWMVDAVRQGTFRHGPQRELDIAVAGARKRRFRDGGFAFGRAASDIDISPLVAVTLAAWGHDQLAATSAGAYFL